MHFELDMIQSAGVGALALVLGTWLTRRISLLKRFCIPSPVSGGLIFSLLTLIIYTRSGIEVTFDGTLRDVFMLAFFTTVGLQSDIRVLKRGGRRLVIMLLLLVVLIALQDAVPVAITKAMDINPLVGLATGSISMCGGHGTAGGFASVLEKMGLTGGGTLAMAAATFGLVAGSMLGGPLAENIIRKKIPTLSPSVSDKDITASMTVESEEMSPHGRRRHISTNESEHQHYGKAVYTILMVMAGGTLLSRLLAMTGVTFPTYFGALILGAVVRNLVGVLSLTKRFSGIEESLDMDRIISVGNLCLSVFLGMAMISLKLWELESLALPLIIILVTQVVMIALFCCFVAFPALGTDYDAAVLVSGICGFGLGATPNAMANMNAVCNKYHYTVEPFLIVPIVGSMFLDMINTCIISLFMQYI